MSNPEKISLKTFWETVEQRLAAYSADELRAILRAMAQETLPADRQLFLEKLGRVEEPAAIPQQALEQEGLLAEIDDFVREFEAAAAEADDWEERSGWGDYYDDEDSLGPYEEFIPSLVDLFERSEAAFDYGQLSLARAAYEKLFEILQIEDDYGRGVRASDLTGVEMGEAAARYLRAVYETEALDHRPQTLFGQMRWVQSVLMRKRSMLDDLVQISPRPLPDQEQFLADWIAFLRTQSGSEADAWLREAIRLSQGTLGLAELAQTEGKLRPRAYLDWFTALAQEGKHREVLLAAQEALQTLPAQLPIRAAIADHLSAAATRLNETEALRAGRWEAFLAKPTLARLLDLWEAAPAGPGRTALMRRAVQHLRAYLAHPVSSQGVSGLGEDNLERPAGVNKSVLAHACLLAEEVEAAYQLAAVEKVLGWSSGDSTQGLVVPSFLALLSGKSPGALPPNLAQLWKSGLQTSLGFFWMDSGQGAESVNKRLERAYGEQFVTLSLSNESQKKFLSWCLTVAQKRTEGIVGGQHRKSYGKAALLVAACAEVLRLRGNPEAADTFLNEIRNHFPRHRAFQDELKAAIQLRG